MTTPAPVIPPAGNAPTGPETHSQGDPAAPTAPEPQGDPNALGDAGKRALQAERDARQRAESELAALRKQAADASKTAEERAAEALREAQDLAAANAARALRYEVAAELGVPLVMAVRLVGATREEIAADAAVLLSQIPGASTPRPTGGVPAAPLDQGGRELSAPDIDTQIAAAEKVGNYGLAISLKRQKAAEAAFKK